MSIKKNIMLNGINNVLRTYFLLFAFSNIMLASCQVTVVGKMHFADGLGRLAIGLLEHLNPYLKMNFISTQPHTFNVTDIPSSTLKFLNATRSETGKVSLLFDPLWHPNHPFFEQVPNSPIKLAYSLFESTEIPSEWVTILNNLFDAVIVADSFYKKVYKDSGITIPIFVLPHGIYLEDFLNQPVKMKKNKPFVFGFSGAFWERKNHELLIEAFIREFYNNPSVILKLHGRFSENHVKERIKRLIHRYKAKNIIIYEKSLTQAEYIAFMKSLDCYVSLAKGEGYSVTPREALALGIPCILSNNTAHKTICATHFVRAVKSDIAEPAFYEVFGKSYGVHFNCKLKDARRALRDVYENYEKHLRKAHQGREWVKQYLYESLRARYLNLLAPRKVIIGNENIVTDDFLMTNSHKLADKFKEHMNSN